MKVIYQQDSFTLDAERISDEKHPVFGDMTVFHGVVIASEIVQKYNDGMAFKSRDELEAYAWTVDGAWVVVGGHPADGIVSQRDQVAGRTVNVRYVKDLLDETKRPHRAGIRADVQMFNEKIPPELLKDMKNGVKSDVSIGFFFSKDDTPGVVEQDSCKGQEYDYVQRDMFHNHLAAGIDNGRCPSPLCGLGADEMRKMLVGDPFAGFEDWGACVAGVKAKNSDLTDEQAKAICGKLKSEQEDNNVEDDLMGKAGKRLRLLLEEQLEELRGEMDAVKETKEWWMTLDWQNDEKLAEVFSHLTEDIRNQITEAGLCPTCGQDEDCPEGEEKNEEGECVPMKKEEEGDVLESNPGFTHPAPAAEAECPEGMTWNAEKKQCVDIADFSELPENKKVDKEKLDPRKVLENSDKLL